MCLPPSKHKKGDLTDRQNFRNKWSGREDLNLRPPEPHSGALARLRHVPTEGDVTPFASCVKVRQLAAGN